MKRILIASTVFFGMNSVVHADVVAGGPIYGGPAQASATCYIYNMGPGAVTLTSLQIFREPNINLAHTINTCGATLAAGNSCGIEVAATNDAAHTCRIVVNPAGAKNRVRGSLEMRDASLNILNNIELR